MKYSEIKALAEKGLITSEQADEICGVMNIQPFSKKEYVFTIFAFLGGAFFLWGIIMLISSNWENIGNIVKISMGLFLMLGAWAVGLTLFYKKNYPKIGESLCLLGAGLWMANIALYGQIYQIASERYQFFLLSWLGIVIVPFVFRMKSIYLFSLGLFCVWVSSLIFDKLSFSEENIFMMGLWALVYALGGIFQHIKSYFIKDYGLLTERLTLLVILGWIFLKCCNSCPNKITWPDFGEHAYVFWMIIPVVVILVLAFLRGRKFHSYWSLVSGLCLSIAIILTPFYANPYLYLGLLFVWAVSTMLFSAKQQSRYNANLGAIAILLLLLRLISDVLFTYQNTGIVLILVGLFFVLLSFFLEKQRRKLVAQILINKDSPTL